MNEFVNSLMMKLENKISNDDLRIVYIQLDLLCADYDIKKKETLPAVLFDDVIEVKHYLISRKIEGLSDATLKQYKRCLEKFFLIVRKATKDISTNDIRLYLYKLKEERGLSDSTIDDTRMYINAFFTWLVDNDYIAKNPCRQIKPIKQAKLEKQPFSEIEMEKLRQACSSDRDIAIIETLYSTGCRVSELVNIKLSDIDTRDKSIQVIGKGKKERTVYLNARSEIAISNYLESRGFESEYLFCQAKLPHNNLSTRSIEKLLKRLGEISNIPNAHPHKVRRTMATDALRHGMPVEEISVLLGHSSISTTMIYAKVDKKDVKRNHEKYVV